MINTWSRLGHVHQACFKPVSMSFVVECFKLGNCEEKGPVRLDFFYFLALILNVIKGEDFGMKISSYVQYCNLQGRNQGGKKSPMT